MKRSLYLPLILFLFGIGIATLALPLPAFTQEKNVDELYENLKKEEAPPTEVGKIGFAYLKKLRPTQIFLGFIEVKEKAKAFEEKSKYEQREYMLEHRIPVVIGPDGNYYIVDHHHLAAALIEVGRDRAIIEVIGKYQGITMTAFWEEMISKNWAFPYGSNSKEPMTALGFSRVVPEKVTDMVDNIYRSLAWAVKNAKGFVKDARVYFIEFWWAKFFEEHFEEKEIRKDFDKIVEKATELAHSEKAASLPGYAPACAATISKIKGPKKSS